MKKTLSLITAALMAVLLFAGCGNAASSEGTNATPATDTVKIVLSDSGITVDGETVSSDSNAAVYVGADIIYYQDGTDDAYGDGDQEDMHTAQEAQAHTVLTITKPGTYQVSGSLSAGQIAVDLGENAKMDSSACVNLVLDNADITCTVAPAIVVYNAYECGSDDEDSATAKVDTSAAGFKLTLADGSSNTVNGSYVAKIYKEGTDEKQHKYDAAIESLVSWEIYGDTGELNVYAENEGIESALYLTINGGKINIFSGDDAINANEDDVSVITINGGEISCMAADGSEGDGIDSNGWIVMTGGSVNAAANPASQDSGIDSDNGIVLEGGTLISIGNMYDEISSESTASYVVLQFASKAEEGKTLLFCDKDGNAVAAFSPLATGSVAVCMAPQLSEGDYTLYQVDSVEGTLTNGVYTDITGYENAVQLGYTGQMAGGFGGAGMTPPDGQMPQNGSQPKGLDGAVTSRPEMPDDKNFEENDDRKAPNGPNAVAGATESEPFDMPDREDMPEWSDDEQKASGMQMPLATDGTVQTVFSLSAQSRAFSGVQPVA